MEEKKILFHKIRNCLGPLQTFLDVVDTSQDAKLQDFQKLCKENFSQLKELLKKIEEGF